MKCHNCGAEWNVSNTIIKICPFCNASLKKIESLEDAFREMYNMSGDAILTSEKMLGYFGDLAPYLKKYQRLLSDFVKIKGNVRLYQACHESNELRSGICRGIVLQLQEEFLYNRDICEMLCDSFCKAITDEQIKTVYRKDGSIWHESTYDKNGRLIKRKYFYISRKIVDCAEYRPSNDGENEEEFIQEFIYNSSGQIIKEKIFVDYFDSNFEKYYDRFGKVLKCIVVPFDEKNMNKNEMNDEKSISDYEEGWFDIRTDRVGNIVFIEAYVTKDFICRWYYKDGFNIREERILDLVSRTFFIVEFDDSGQYLLREACINKYEQPDYYYNINLGEPLRIGKIYYEYEYDEDGNFLRRIEHDERT